jgi:hypothetical protein
MVFTFKLVFEFLEHIWAYVRMRGRVENVEKGSPS